MKQTVTDSGTSSRIEARPVIIEIESQWIATSGKDLSGHDFGCERVWLAWNRDPCGFGCCEHLVEIKDNRYLMLVSAESARFFTGLYRYVTDYMLTDIKTPEAPPE